MERSGLKAHSILLQDGITEEELRQQILKQFGSLEKALRHVLQNDSDKAHKALKMLLKLGVSATEKLVGPLVISKKIFKDDASPLEIACRTRNVEAVRILCEHGADPREVRIEGISLLHFTIWFHDHKVDARTQGKVTAKVASILLEHGAYPNEISTKYGTPLQAAISMWMCYWVTPNM